MNFKTRNLIVLNRNQSDSALYEELVAHHWNVLFANDITQVRKLLKIHTFYAALCLLEPDDDASYGEDLKMLFNRTADINWVIALPKNLLAHTENTVWISRLISECCYDYLTLPLDPFRLPFVLGHAYGMAEIASRAYQQITDYPIHHGIVGNSPEIKKLLIKIAKVSKTDDSILIEGETGTGKELIANAIHHNSSRAGKPIVAINCGAFSKDLIQAELFGYEKGAFTGAQQRSIGRIEASEGGILFLDEIGDLPMPQQVNLLRFLQEKVIERVGGKEKLFIDVRIIAATHVDLLQAVKAGTFREDLYYRLRVLHLNAPPLRERNGDIELLAWHFFYQFSQSGKRNLKGFSKDAMFLLLQHHWPGNIRELMNCIKQAVVMSDNRLLTPADLCLEKRHQERVEKTLEEARSESDRVTILNMLQSTGYSMNQTALKLDISRTNLYRLMGKYQIDCK